MTMNRDNDHLLDTFVECLRPIVNDPATVDRLMPAELMAIEQQMFKGRESVILGLFLGFLLDRGAAPMAIVRYLTCPGRELPFEGCEQRLFDMLLDTFRARVDDPGLVARMVLAMLDAQQEIFQRAVQLRQATDTIGPTTAIEH